METSPKHLAKTILAKQRKSQQDKSIFCERKPLPTKGTKFFSKVPKFSVTGKKS
jgi:hypothetical protein